MAVAHETHRQTRRANAVTSFRGWKDRGGRRTNDPARCKGARRIVGRCAQEKTERVAGRCRECKASRGDLIDAARADLADRHADGATTQRFFHRPQHIACARGCDRDQLFGSNTGRIETWPIGGAIFAKRKILGDPKHSALP